MGVGVEVALGSVLLDALMGSVQVSDSLVEGLVARLLAPLALVARLLASPALVARLVAPAAAACHLVCLVVARLAAPDLC